jgi:hypothetical protein
MGGRWSMYTARGVGCVHNVHARGVARVSDLVNLRTVARMAVVP